MIHMDPPTTPTTPRTTFLVNTHLLVQDLIPTVLPLGLKATVPVASTLALLAPTMAHPPQQELDMALALALAVAWAQVQVMRLEPTAHQLELVPTALVLTTPTDLPPRALVLVATALVFTMTPAPALSVLVPILTDRSR
jgi:hypothetical protein